MARIRQALLACVLCVSAASVMALDANDITELLENGVQDSVIINMVQSNKLARPLTAREIVNLTRGGASQPLLEYLTSSGAVNPSYVATPPAPVIVEPAPTTVVTPQPNVIVTQPPTVVTQAPAVVYDTPTYYYPQSYVYPQPYYYPYRSGPSISFWFGSGGRHYYGSRHSGGYRPSHHGRPGGRPSGGRPHHRR